MSGRATSPITLCHIITSMKHAASCFEAEPTVGKSMLSGSGCSAHLERIPSRLGSGQRCRKALRAAVNYQLPVPAPTQSPASFAQLPPLINKEFINPGSGQVGFGHLLRTVKRIKPRTFPTRASPVLELMFSRSSSDSR